MKYIFYYLLTVVVFACSTPGNTCNALPRIVQHTPVHTVAHKKNSDGQCFLRAKLTRVKHVVVGSSVIKPRHKHYFRPDEVVLLILGILINLVLLYYLSYGVLIITVIFAVFGGLFFGILFLIAVESLLIIGGARIWIQLFRDKKREFELKMQATPDN